MEIIIEFTGSTTACAENQTGKPVFLAIIRSTVEWLRLSHMEPCMASARFIMAQSTLVVVVETKLKK